jgi:glycoside/pentoside/hexuronide:cation symporter, GPH family
MGKNTKKDFRASRFERSMYNTYFLGQNMIFVIVTTFLAVYYTSVLGISATAVGTILLLARIWDALMDPLLATVIERSKLKGGKFKPWVNLASISVPLMTILCFGFSDQLLSASDGARIAYAAVTYLIWGTLYAAADAPAFALSTVITPVPEERNVLLANNQLLGILGILIGISTFPLALKATGNNYILSVGIFVIVSLLAMNMVRFTKERVKSNKKEPTIKEIFGSVLNNKYLKIIVLVSIIANGVNFSQSLAPYVATDIFKDPTKVSLMLGLGILPTVLIAPFVPMLVRKVGKIKLLSIALGASIVFSILMYFTTYESFNLFLVLTLLKSIFVAPQVVIYPMFFADTIEYDCYKNGTRFEAATFATQTFMSKISVAISGGLGLWIIGFAGYVASKNGQVITQSASTLKALWATFNLGPAIGCLIALIIFIKFYDLKEEKVKEMALANQEKANNNQFLA